MSIVERRRVLARLLACWGEWLGLGGSACSRGVERCRGFDCGLRRWAR
jgi:hypothetical protein